MWDLPLFGNAKQQNILHNDNDAVVDIPAVYGWRTVLRVHVYKNVHAFERV